MTANPHKQNNDGRERLDFYLPRREEQVLSAAARGLTVSETAAQLHISPETVKTYRKRARWLFAARTITHAVYLAERAGLLPHTTDE